MDYTEWIKPINTNISDTLPCRRTIGGIRNQMPISPIHEEYYPGVSKQFHTWSIVSPPQCTKRKLQIYVPAQETSQGDNGHQPGHAFVTVTMHMSIVVFDSLSPSLDRPLVLRD